MSALEEYNAPIQEFARLAKSLEYEMECISTRDYFHIQVLNPDLECFLALVHDSYKSMEQPLYIMKDSIKKKEDNVFYFEAESLGNQELDFGFTVKFTPSNRTK